MNPLPSSPTSCAYRIGVLTFHRCINYGSYWQARSLLKGLELLGFKAELLDHRSPRTDRAEWRVALEPTLPTSVRKQDRELYECKVRKFSQLFCDLPMSPRFDLDHPEELPKYDAIVVGSDEVWNLRHPWFGEKPAFFGGGLPTDRLISYAASFGNFSSWEGIGSPWTDLLARFDHISVRDENSWWMLKNALGIEVPIVLDPALQWAIDPDGTWKGPSSPFALVYGHNFSQEFVSKARDWSRRRNLPLLSIGYRNDWADDSWLDADPHDFAHAFARSRAVLTNFFHGCIFSLRNQRPFACEKSPYRSIKISGLVELLETESRLVSPSDPMDGLLDEPIPDATLDRIEALRRASTDYLAQALQFVYVC